ncbi:MAG: YncE family protein [Acidobacteriota bacterium]
MSLITRRRCAVSGLLLASVLLSWPAGAASPPDALSYQGVLRDAENRPIEVATSMRFHFWDDAAKTTLLLSDDQGLVDVSRGLFNVKLGTGTVTPGAATTLAEVFAQHGTVHVELEIGGELLSPLVEFRSTGYALNTDRLDGMDATDFATAVHAHSGEDITSGRVGEPYLDDVMTRDDEVVPFVLEADGQGSGLDADLFDGRELEDFVLATGAVGRTPEQIASLLWHDVSLSFEPIATNSQPHDVVFAGSDIITVTRTANTMQWFDTDAGTLSRSISIGIRPHSLAFDGEHVWVTMSSNDTVRKVRVRDGSIRGTFDTGADPRGVAFDGTHVWVCNFADDSVDKIRASDGVRLDRILVEAGPTAIASDGTQVWIACETANSVIRLRISDGVHLGGQAVGLNPSGIAYDGAHVWVTNTGGDTVTRLRADVGLPAGAYAVGPSPQQVVFDGRNVWVSHEDGVSQLRATDGAQLAEHPLALDARGLAFDGRKMWVASTSGNTLTRF